jgi:hypothetical protein
MNVGQTAERQPTQGHHRFPPPLRAFAYMSETSKSSAVSVRLSSSATNEASSIAAPGLSASVAMFSKPSGNGSILL